MNLLPKQPSVKGPADWFTGDVYFDVIAPGTESRGKVNAVHFAPASRTAWHRHANGALSRRSRAYSRSRPVPGRCPRSQVVSGERNHANGDRWPARHLEARLVSGDASAPTGGFGDDVRA